MDEATFNEQVKNLIDSFESNKTTRLEVYVNGERVGLYNHKTSQAGLTYDLIFETTTLRRFAPWAVIQGLGAIAKIKST